MSDIKEAETRAELIDPALKEAGWGVMEDTRIRREFPITIGRLQGAGTRSKSLSADYVLFYKNKKLAVVEAKSEAFEASEGVHQAKTYAGMLQVRFTYATNGKTIYKIDMETGVEGEVDKYPTPEELWAETFKVEDKWRDEFSKVPFETRGETFTPRYYQDNAVEKSLEAISKGEDRILLNLATGTGKTCIAFQIVWKLFHSRWNLKRDGKGLPNVLFLADRNILANQAFNAFSAFEEDALARIKPSEIKKAGQVPTNASVFFTIFQTFMSGTDENGKPKPYFGQYDKDFFDFIIIDECHRGGANDESNWRDILNYFSPAVQLGLTATPKRKDNVDTYAYFGEPVYTYSLKEGINDGFLTPFKVKQIATTLDEYVYTSDDMLIEGEVEEGKIYDEEDFNRIIEIKEREEYRVKLFMDAVNQDEKSIVFCSTQEHAAAVRDLINQNKQSDDTDYCVRVTARDGATGDRYLRTFQDNEKTIPTVLTTSQKLSTGVDARNVRNIVLMRPVNSMIEFKQIVGRGTRLFDGKDYFTIYDFVKAYHHFNDPEWDGEPLEPQVCINCGESPCVCEKKVCDECGRRPCICEKEPCPKCGKRPCECERRKRIKIKLADGKERNIQHMMATSFWGPDGKPLSTQEFINKLFGDLPELFKNEDELRRLWSKPDTRKGLLNSLDEKGYGEEQLNDLKKAISAEKSDVFDVLAYIAYALPPITREERVNEHKEEIFANFDDKKQVFIDFVLEQYVKEGVTELDQEKLPTLLQIKYKAIDDAVKELGSIDSIRNSFVDFQKYLYSVHQS